jgi:serine protease
MVVAAAGNAQGAVTRPGNCRGVVAVAALNRDGFKAHYSSFGRAVTLATVGGDDGDGPSGTLLGDGGLLTLFNAGRAGAGDNIYARSFGTSFATPIVAGTAALMLSVNPNLTVDRLIHGLTVTARPHVHSPWLAACSADNSASCLCTTDSCGAGMLDGAPPRRARQRRAGRGVARRAAGVAARRVRRRRRGCRRARAGVVAAARSGDRRPHGGTAQGLNPAPAGGRLS